MKHFGKQFSELLFRSGITQKSVGDKLGLSHVTIRRMKEQESVDAATLEKLCRMFKVPVNYFFDADVVGTTTDSEQKNSNIEIELLRSENAMLHKLIDEKERTIQILEKLTR